MNKDQTGDEADFAAERSDRTDQPAGAAHRSADEKLQNFVVDVRDCEVAPIRNQVPVEKDANRKITPLRCGGLPPASCLADFFSDRKLIEPICAGRIKLATRRHEEEFFPSMLAGQAARAIPADGDPMLPGRKTWRHYRPYEGQRTRSSKPSNLLALIDATIRLRKKNPNLAWNKNLEAKINAIRSRAFGDDFSFAEPAIRPKLKKGQDYRATASFSDDDKIIDSLTAQYFRQQIDSSLLDCCLAFRLRKNGDPRTRAMERIDEFRGRHKAAPIYGAEADIRGCYDTICHDMVWEQLEALAKAGNIALDPKALAVFRAYLDVYSFPRNVLGAEQELRDKKGPRARFPWPLDELRELHEDPLNSRIGIAQGGALSCLIVNILLHRADIAVEEFRLEGNDLLYLRFCDDVIFLSPSRKVTARAFEIYLGQLRLLKLPVYPPVSLPTYRGKERKTCREEKSKALFAWGNNIQAGEIPVIGFLGYEMWRDGFLRIRRSSIEKQKQKVTAIVGQAVRHLDEVIATGSKQALRVSVRSYVTKIVGKVIATAVGRVTIGKEATGPLPRTFASGFRFLVGRRFPPKQLRELDHHRERNIRRLRRRATKVPPQKLKSRKKRVRIPRFFGRPFSYLAQFFFPGKKSRRSHRPKRRTTEWSTIL